MSWGERSQAFDEWVRKNKVSAAQEYQTIAPEDSTKDTHQTEVSEEDFSAVRRFRHIAINLREERISKEI